MFFFFQAEDGIRYRNVTGVQTCALPIFVTTDTTAKRGDKRRHFLRREHLIEARFLDVEDFTLQRQNRLVLAVTRSEERRVGKECGWRWRLRRGEMNDQGQESKAAHYKHE